jgi:polysaccharide pyruvyl transferase WcaK-like protein
MFTDAPSPLVAASLRRVRPVASEIVVAVDDRVDPETLGPLRDVADRVLRAEFVHPLEANLAWLHRQATGDWVLRLDGDDLVSDALVRRLATPGWDEGITHAFVPYRWVWGPPGHVLDQPPWWPDPALRLIRNLAGIARFPHGAHEVAEVAGDARFLAEPLYHLDLVLRSEAARSEKVAGYEDLNPGHRTDRGWSVSTAYYLPERLSPPPRTTLVPGVDQAAIAEVLAAAAAPGPEPDPDAASDLPHVSAADRRSPAPQPGDLGIRILSHEPLPVVAGRSAIVTAALTNRGDRPWDPADEPAEALGGRFFDAVGAQVGFEVREALPGPVAPGEEVLARVALPAWTPSGATRLDLGLVQDGVGWHDAVASIPLTIEQGRRVLVRTGLSTFGHLGDDLITREVLSALAIGLPDVVPMLLAHPTDGIAERFGCEVVESPVAQASLASKAAEPNRRSRDLVNQARLMARGQPPADPAVADALAPFAAASALVLAPGGGLASRYSAEALMVCAIEALIARAFGLPVLLEGPSIGPIETRRDNSAIAQLLNDAQRVTVRDRASADAARRIGRAVEPEVVPDPASAALRHLGRGPADAAAWLASVNVPPERRYVVVSLRDGSPSDLAHLETVRRALAALPEHTAWIYLPHCTADDGLHPDDLAVLRADQWAGAHLVPFDPGLGDRAAVGLIAGATMTIGTRFHLSVLAAAAGTPAVCLVGDDYDRLRVRGLRSAPGVRVVELDEPDAAEAAVQDLLAAPRPQPTPAWDAAAFAAALGAVLPAAPRLA